jgi:hypothetical protein
VATAQVLDLILAVLEKWSSREGSAGLKVVPVAVQELSAHRDLIDAAIRDAGGVFLDTNELINGAEGEVDEELRDIVTSSLSVPRAGGEQLNLNVEEVGHETIRATIDGVDQPTSPGLRTVLGIAASLFHRDLKTTSLAVLAYDESGLEEDLADAVWRMFTERLPNTSVASLSTLIVLIEASNIRYDRHCAPGLSLEYRLGQQGLEHRKDHVANQVMITRLCNRAEPFLVLFLGAGFSGSSAWPLGDEVREEALRNMFNSSAPYEELVGSFYDYLRSEERLLPQEQDLSRAEFIRSPFTLERVLREEKHHYGADKSPTLKRLHAYNGEAVEAPGPAVSALHRLIDSERRLVIVTVNFDTLIEINDNVELFVDDDEFVRFPDYLENYSRNGGRVPVLKLHGTIDRPNTIIATVDDTSVGLSVPKSAALRSLLPHTVPLPWIYVGYSARDLDITNLLREREFGEGLYENWVSPFPVATIKEFAEQWRRELWRRSGVVDVYWERCITMTADAFFEELERCW